MNDFRFFSLITIGMSIWVMVAPKLWSDRLITVLLCGVSGIILTLFSRDKK